MSSRREASHPVLYVFFCIYISQRNPHAQVIREAFRSGLPIEVFYFGKEEEHAETLTALKVSTLRAQSCKQDCYMALLCAPVNLNVSSFVPRLSVAQNIRGVFVQDAEQLPRPPYLGPWPAKLHDYAKKVFSLFSSRFDQVGACRCVCRLHCGFACGQTSRV